MDVLQIIYSKRGSILDFHSFQESSEHVLCHNLYFIFIIIASTHSAMLNHHQKILLSENQLSDIINPDTDKRFPFLQRNGSINKRSDFLIFFHIRTNIPNII